MTREGASERGQRTSFNGADGISNIEGKVARVSASKFGKRASFKFNIRAFHDAVLELGSVQLPVVTARGSTASSLNMAKALTRIWSDWVSGVLGE